MSYRFSGMSITLEKLNLQRVIDKRIDGLEPDNRIYNVLESGAEVSYYDTQSQGQGGIGTTIAWSLNPDNASVFIDRRILMSQELDLTFRGTSAGVGIPLLQCAGLAVDPTAAVGVTAGLQYYDCPRSHPIARAISSISLQLGTDQISQSVNQYSTAILHYSNDVDNQDKWTSMTPTMLDQAQNYADLDGFARDPMRGYGDNPLQCPRGGFVGATVVRNDSTGTAADVAIIRLRVTELIDMSPLLFEKGRQGLGFRGVATMGMSVNLGGKGTGLLGNLISSYWSHKTLPAGPQSTFTSGAVLINSAKIKYHCISAPPSLTVPRLLNYNYSDLHNYQTQVNNLFSQGIAQDIPMNTTTLNSIPTRVIIWVAPQDSYYDFTSSDTYFAINNVVVSFDTKQNLLSSATQQDLYAIAVKNGCNSSWSQFTKHVGSVLALDFGEDIPLRELRAPGSRGAFTLQIKVSCTNLRATAVLPVLNVLVISEGVMTIVDGQVTRQVGVLTEQDVLNSKSMAAVPYLPSGSLFGGAWYDDVWSFIKRAGRPVLNVAKAVLPTLYPAALPALETVDAAARAVGIGLKGGKRLSRAQMQRLMMR